jgi:hypothetical protein
MGRAGQNLASGAALAAALAALAVPAQARTLHLSPRGSDSAAGTSRAPLRTLGEAWGRIPQGSSGSWTLRLAPGSYRRGAPVYWENRSGRIRIEGRGRVNLPTMNVYRVRGLTVRNVRLSGDGDVFHCEQCNSVTLDRVTIRAGESQEAVKLNQSTRMEVRNSDIRGGQDNAFDAVAVQGLRLTGNRIGGAGDWCAYAKGGSSEVVVKGNLFSRCGTGGFSAGQGTGLQWMTPPYFHYEARGVLVEGNSVRDVEGAAFGVQGGFNVLVRDNLAMNVGSRSHVLEVGYGSRSCDGAPGDEGRERCGDFISQGAWGTARVDDGENFVRIPNRHVYLYDNVILNEAASRWQVFQVPGEAPAQWQLGSNVPAGARADSDLRIAGNIIWDGGPGHPLGLGEEGCPAGSSCAPEPVREGNAINTRRPELTVLRSGWLVRAGWTRSAPRSTPPAPDWSDRPAGEPAGWSAWPR